MLKQIKFAFSAFQRVRRVHSFDQGLLLRHKKAVCNMGTALVTRKTPALSFCSKTADTNHDSISQYAFLSWP